MRSHYLRAKYGVATGFTNNFFIFKGDLTSVTVDGNCSHASLPYSEQYLYSVASNSESESSGMTEWLCLYVFEGELHRVLDSKLVM